ncbi:hypothetical protein M3147_15085 [Agromyces mediolanus]|uniref:hypothetical protein n=1 Tax=Agromyces mediolanus TaxID=41986 RepID=UPI00203C53BD|nr:hypothetical protein [Agromyces mediolanus]MCM3658579.1 hypothetical protein [Agromyces mediolanus]
MRLKTAMGDRAAFRSAVAGVIACGAVFLAACSGGASTAEGGSTESSGGADAGYLSEVDAEGLLGGRTVSQVLSQAMHECMVDAGWVNLTVADDGSMSGEIPAAQSDQYEEDFGECQAQVELNYPVPEMTESAIRERYAREVGTRDCLIAQGYSISDPPSEQVWVETFTSDPASLWLPYFEVFTQAQLSASDEAQLKAKAQTPVTASTTRCQRSP